MSEPKVTQITEDITFRGEIQFQDQLLIEGKVEGQITSHGKAEITASAEVKADIEVRDLLLKGTLQGNIKASDSFIIASTGKLQGDVSCKSIQIEKGGRHNGSTIMK